MKIQVTDWEIVGVAGLPTPRMNLHAAIVDTEDYVAIVNAMKSGKLIRLEVEE